MPKLTPKQAAALIQLDPAVWFASCSKILDKNRKLITPIPNIFQLRIFHAYVWCIQNGIPPRIICLKPRRVGGTTACAGLSYFHCRRFPTKHISIADTNEKSDILFQMFCMFAEKDAFAWGTTFESNNKEAKFSNNSLTVKRSAEAPKQTRGDTLQSAHESEACIWKDVGPLSADETAAALLSALGNGKHTLGLNESTAKGARGYFYKEWQRARWPDWNGPPSLASYWQKYSVQNNDKDASEWRRVFAAWFEFPEYTCGPHQSSAGLQPVSSDAESDDILGTLDEKERKLIDLYDVNVNQLKWRRWMIRNNCLNQVARFQEEFPATPEEAFLQSGSPVFDSDGLSVIELTTRAADVEFGNIVEQARSRVVGWQQVPEIQAWAKIWEHPRPGRKFIVSVDVMTGEDEIYGTGEDSDRHSVQVWRAAYTDELKQVWKPKLVARIKPPYQEDNSLLCEKVMLLSRYYGDCIIVVEANKGVAVIAKLRDEHNAHLYVREEHDSTVNKMVKKLGWDTNMKTRDIIIDAIQDACRDSTVDIPCPNLLDEMKTFIRDKTGKRTAGSSAHDDDVLAAGMGIHLLPFATTYRERVVPLPEAPDERAWR